MSVPVLGKMVKSNPVRVLGSDSVPVNLCYISSVVFSAAGLKSIVLCTKS